MRGEKPDDGAKTETAEAERMTAAARLKRAMVVKEYDRTFENEHILVRTHFEMMCRD